MTEASRAHSQHSGGCVRPRRPLSCAPRLGVGRGARVCCWPSDDCRGGVRAEPPANAASCGAGTVLSALRGPSQRLASIPRTPGTPSCGRHSLGLGPRPACWEARPHGGPLGRAPPGHGHTHPPGKEDGTLLSASGGPHGQRRLLAAEAARAAHAEDSVPCLGAHAGSAGHTRGASPNPANAPLTLCSPPSAGWAPPCAPRPPAMLNGRVQGPSPALSV